MENRTCAIEGCDKAPRSRTAEWCNAHYFRWYRTGDPGPAKIWDKKRTVCTVVECDDRAVGHGFCSLHHQRFVAHGDPHHVTPPPSGESHGCWKGQDVGYGAVHMRVRAVRGSASRRFCEHCGTQAKHWAYDHTDPNELQSDRGPYSTDLERYIALCVPCHKRFDLGGADTAV